MGTAGKRHSAKRPLGFWVRYDFRESASVEMRNACIDRFDRYCTDHLSGLFIGCVADGWDWTVLVYPGEGKLSMTSADRLAAVARLGGDRDVVRFEVGPLVATDEQLQLAVEQVSEAWERLVAKRRGEGGAE